MDWTRAIEEERAALMRIAALLLALAGLADIAAGRSPAMRGFVLWVLRRAEAVAQDFVGDGADAQLVAMPVQPAGTRPSDAMWLAAGLRRLARQLEHQARLMLRMCGARGIGAQPLQLGVMPAMHDLAHALTMPTAFGWRIPHPAPDTS